LRRFCIIRLLLNIFKNPGWIQFAYYSCVSLVAGATFYFEFTSFEIQMVAYLMQLMATQNNSTGNGSTKMARKDSLKNMREILIKRRDALRQAISGDDSLLKELSRQTGGDVVDFASDSACGELSSQLAEVETRELQFIELALQSMKNGTYGKCEACRRSIPLARLQALPYATFCIDCKRAAEKAGVEPGTVVDWSQILDGADTLTDMDFNVS
jgi:DnaK suppressor protein